MGHTCNLVRGYPLSQKLATQNTSGGLKWSLLWFPVQLNQRLIFLVENDRHRRVRWRPECQSTNRDLYESTTWLKNKKLTITEKENREGLELCLHHRNVRKGIFLLRVCSSKPKVIFRQLSYYRRNEQYKKKITWGFRILKGIGDVNGETRCLRNAGSSNVSFLRRVRKILMKSWKGISYSCRDKEHWSVTSILRCYLSLAPADR